MKASRHFPPDLLDAIHQGKILRIRAGRQPHRFIGIWAVVVERRVFVRSWSLKPRSWYRTFLEEPVGTIQVGDREIPVRAVRTRSERLKEAVDRAYLEKYPKLSAWHLYRHLCPSAVVHLYEVSFASISPRARRIASWSFSSSSLRGICSSQ